MKEGTRRREGGAGPMVLRMISTFSDSSSIVDADPPHTKRLQLYFSHILFNFKKIKIHFSTSQNLFKKLSIFIELLFYF